MLNALTSGRKFVLSLFFILIFSFPVFAQGLVFKGETLKYKVMAYGVQIAEIEVSTQQKFTYKKKPSVKVTARAKYKKFFDFSASFNSVLDGTDSMYVLSSGRDVRFLRNTLSSHKFEYDYDSLYFTSESVDLKGKKQTDTTRLKPGIKIWDPLALFFFARQNCDTKAAKVIATHLQGHEFVTTFNFFGRKFKMNIDAVEYPIRTIHISGRADWNNMYLINGGFNVWVTDDEAKVPVLGTVETKFGVLTVELTEWKRLQWQPPVFNKDNE